MLSTLNTREEIVALRVSRNESQIYVRVFCKCACCGNLLDRWLPIDLRLWN